MSYRWLQWIKTHTALGVEIPPLYLSFLVVPKHLHITESIISNNVAHHLSIHTIFCVPKYQSTISDIFRLHFFQYPGLLLKFVVWFTDCGVTPKVEVTEGSMDQTTAHSRKRASDISETVLDAKNAIVLQQSEARVVKQISCFLFAVCPWMA